MVSYAAVLSLRAARPELQLVRRLPWWMVGHFETPWGEVHTYYPCGAFSFGRGVQDTGFVAQLRARRGSGRVHHYYEDRLVFCDLEREDEEVNGRVGVCVKHLEGMEMAAGASDEDHEATRAAGASTPSTATATATARATVLVWQDRSEPEPRPLLGPHIPPQLASGYGLPEPGQSVQFGNFLVSAMVVKPLECPYAKPPPKLIDALAAYCFDPRILDGMLQDGMLSTYTARGRAEMVAFESIHGRVDAAGFGGVTPHAPPIAEVRRRLDRSFGAHLPPLSPLQRKES